MSLINLLTFVSLMVLAVKISTAMPLSRSGKRSVDSLPFAPHVFLSHHTGMFVVVSEDGNVTASHGDLLDISAHFYLRDIEDNKVIIESAEFNGSFLHFALGNGSSNTSESGSSNDTTVTLRVGEITGSEAHHWTGEFVPGNIVLYSVTLEDGKTCYLAFESDGKPVEDPCVHKDELLTKALLFKLPVLFA